jgi:hypothetical protein
MAYKIKSKKVKEIAVVKGSSDYISIKKLDGAYEVESFASDLFDKKKKFKTFKEARGFLKSEVVSYLEGAVPNEKKYAEEMIKENKVDSLK